MSVQETIDELVEEIQGIDAQLAQRNAAIKAYRVECLAAGHIGKQRWFAANTDYERWRARAIAAKGHLIAELRDAKVQLRNEHAEANEDFVKVGYRRLRRAVETHRQKVMEAGYEPTGLDEDLWAALED